MPHEREPNRVEELPLKDQLKQTLEEARVVLPGVQAIFGFQLIAVFSDGFSKHLSSTEQQLHLVATGMTALAAAIVMAPAALHRQTEPESVSTRLVKACTVLITVGMAPLLIGLPLDFYLISRVILKDPNTALVLGIVLFLLLGGLWYAMPAALRKYLKKPGA